MDMEKVRTWIGKIISFIRENKLTAATFLGVLIGILKILFLLYYYSIKRKVFVVSQVSCSG